MNSTIAAPVYVTRDGKHVATLASEDDLLGWFIRNTSFSMDYALTHNGYAVTSELPPTDGLNGYTVVNVHDIELGTIPGGGDYGYAPNFHLPVTVSIRMERIPRRANTVDHKPIVDHLDFSITSYVWRPDRSDIITGGATVDPLLALYAAEGARLADGWTRENVRELWNLAPWHLNTMTAACAHMDTDKLVREGDGYGGTRIACGYRNTCPDESGHGYTYGAQWLVRPLPADFLANIRRLFPNA